MSGVKINFTLNILYEIPICAADLFLHFFLQKEKQKIKNKDGVKKNLKQLDLSNDQQKQIDDIHANSKQEKDKINNDKTLTDEQKKEKIKAVDKDSKHKIHSVLTPEQREKMKKKKII